LRFPGAAAPLQATKAKTSVAGTAIPHSGNDKVQHGEKPGRTQKIAHPRVLWRFGATKEVSN